MSTHEDRLADMRQDRADDELGKHAVTHGWQPGETHRFAACTRHASALSRMDFWDAFDRAEDCDDCETEVRDDSA